MNFMNQVLLEVLGNELNTKRGLIKTMGHNHYEFYKSIFLQFIPYFFYSDSGRFLRVLL